MEMEIEPKTMRSYNFVTWNGGIETVAEVDLSFFEREWRYLNGMISHIMTCQNKPWWIWSYSLLCLLVTRIFIVRSSHSTCMYTKTVVSGTTYFFLFFSLLFIREGNTCILLLALFYCYDCSCCWCCCCRYWYFLSCCRSLHVRKINFLEVLLHHRYSYRAYHFKSNVFQTICIDVISLFQHQ